MTTSLRVLPVPGPGAEDVLIGPDGRVWTGCLDGAIVAVTPDGRHSERVALTGGRPLGLEWLPDGRLLICDAERGLLALETDSGEIEELVTEVDGAALRFTNNAAVASDGTIYFSDSSRHWGVAEWKNDLVSHTLSGRLFRRSPDGQVTTILDGLAFANGVALSADEREVYVAETALRRIRRVRLEGGEPLPGTRRGREGQPTQPTASELLADDLPGYPDNIARGSDGLIWSAIASPPDPVLTRLQSGPSALRAAALHLPDALNPSPKRTVRALAHTSDGTLVHDLTADASDWHMVTGVREHDGQVWLGSLVEPAVAVVALR